MLSASGNSDVAEILLELRMMSYVSAAACMRSESEVKICVDYHYICLRNKDIWVFEGNKIKLEQINLINNNKKVPDNNIIELTTWR